MSKLFDHTFTKSNYGRRGACVTQGTRSFRSESMATTDGIRLPLRWQFAPLQDSRDRSITWKWRAYTQDGKVAMESETAFDSLTECMSDAKLSGYGES